MKRYAHSDACHTWCVFARLRQRHCPVGLPPVIGDAILNAEPLRHGQANAATGGIWRVRGPAGTAILKVARRPSAADPPKAFPTSDEPTHWNYWQREALAYQSGLAATAYADAGVPARPCSGPAPGPTAASNYGWPTSAASRASTGPWRGWPGSPANSAPRRPAGPPASPPSRGCPAAGSPSTSPRHRHRVGPVEPAVWDHPNLAPWPEPVRTRLRRAVGGPRPGPGRRRGRRTHPVSSRPLARQPGRRRRDLGPARLGLRGRGRGRRGSRQPDHRRLHRRPDGRRPAARTRRGRC